MKQVSLENYTKKQLSKYVKTYKNGSMLLSFLLEKAKSDERLAELSKTYFLLTEEYEKARRFDHFFPTKYNNRKELLKSNNKYVVQHKTLTSAKTNLKLLLRKDVLLLMDKTRVSMYKAAKVANTNQSNLAQFFKHKQLTKLSLAKLYLLRNYLNKM